MAAATFGHVPAVFVPAGPMTSGIANDAKSKVRNAFAEGQATREELMAAEMASYQSRLNALTGGEGRYTLALSHYDAVPPAVQAQLASQYRAKDEE